MGKLSKELNYIEIPTTDAGIFSGPGGPGGGDDPFSIKLREYMKGPPRIIIEELSARTGIPRRTIERLRTYKYKYLDGVVFPNHDPIELKHVIACIVNRFVMYFSAQGSRHLFKL